MADTPEGKRDQKRRDVLNYALQTNAVGGHVRYLDENSTRAIQNMIRTNGGQAYYTYLSEVAKTKVDKAAADQKEHPIMPYTVAQYGTATGDLSLRSSLLEETGQAGAAGSQLVATVNGGEVIPAEVLVPGRETLVRADDDRLQYVYKVIVGKTPTVLSVISRAQELWRRAPEAKIAGQPDANLFQSAGKFYVVNAPECKAAQLPLPQGAFHVIIDPLELTEHEKNVILANVFHSSVRLLSVFAKSPRDLHKLGFLPDKYMCHTAKRDKLFREIPPISVIFNRSQGKIDGSGDACLRDTKTSEFKKTCDVVPDMDETQYRFLYTFNLKNSSYVRRMACHYKSPLKVKRSAVKPLNIHWIVNHKLRPRIYNLPNQAYQAEYLTDLEIQGRQARFEAGERMSRRSRRKAFDYESETSEDSNDDCDTKELDELSSDDDFEAKNELSDDQDDRFNEEEDEDEDIMRTSSKALAGTLDEAIKAIEKEKAKPSKACHKRDGDLLLRTVASKPSRRR